VLQGKPLLFLSGIGMTNAAMATQLALDRFHLTHAVVSGIAGGVNPGLHIGASAADHSARVLLAFLPAWR
jgi:adenosylhomocysteine nucleosidase